MPPLTDLTTETVHQTLPTAPPHDAAVRRGTVCISALILLCVVLQFIPPFRVQQAEAQACPAKNPNSSELSSPVGTENVQPGSDLSS